MKPHINNNETPKLQITELDSIRDIVALSGTHLEEATEPKKTVFYTEIQHEQMELD